jgi:hypothetical protein
MNTTQKLIVKMLLENTGKHFLDSGFENGRAWQRNKGKDFEKENKVTLDFYDNELQYFTVSTFHYLSEVLELDIFAKKINKYLNGQRNKDIDSHWVQECSELLIDKYNIELIGDTVNTYNYENNLSQILLYTIFKNSNDVYCLLQIHGGADIRGGYTDTQCFKLNSYLTGNVEVFGTVNGVNVDNMYNGYSLTDENGDEIKIKETDNYSFNMYINDDTYIYL